MSQDKLTKEQVINGLIQLTNNIAWVTIHSDLKRINIDKILSRLECPKCEKLLAIPEDKINENAPTDTRVIWQIVGRNIIREKIHSIIKGSK